MTQLTEHQREVAARELCRRRKWSDKLIPVCLEDIIDFIDDHEDILAAVAAGQRAPRDDH